MRRVVVTGLGIVCPLGVGVQNVWTRLLRGESGVYKCPALDALIARVPRGSLAHEWDPARYIPRSESRSMSSDYISFALGAADEALQDAGLLASARAEPRVGEKLEGPYSSMRVGVSIGNGIGGLEEISASAVGLAEGGKLSPFFVPRILVNMAAGGVAMRYGLRGPCLTAATACASGAHAIGDAARAIACGAADAMVAGGSEAVLGKLAVAGFGRARALASEAGAGSFSAGRDGFVLGEGAGCMILETLEGALARGAPCIYGEVRGFGAGCDAFHITSPRTDGSGAAACMRAALADADLNACDVGYINAHATGTAGGDGVEVRGIANVWEGQTVAVSSTKGAVGHLLGAAGAVEGIFSVLALKHEILPVTKGLTQLDPELSQFSVEQGGAIKFLGRGGAVAGIPARGIQAVLSNSFGFGGVNASLLFAKC